MAATFSNSWRTTDMERWRSLMAAGGYTWELWTSPTVPADPDAPTTNAAKMASGDIGVGQLSADQTNMQLTIGVLADNAVDTEGEPSFFRILGAAGAVQGTAKMAAALGNADVTVIDDLDPAALRLVRESILNITAVLQF